MQTVQTVIGVGHLQLPDYIGLVGSFILILGVSVQVLLSGGDPVLGGRAHALGASLEKGQKRGIGDRISGRSPGGLPFSSF